MKFRHDNNYLYGQDHGIHRIIPSGIDFTVERCGDHYKLVAAGYGQHGDYGNGCLHVYPRSWRLRKRLERECDK